MQTDPREKTPDPLAIAQVLGRVPSGIYVLTIRHSDDETGMLASWVMQAGFDPPMVTVAVNRERYLVEWLTAGSPFAINIVREHDKRLLRHFARGFAPGEPAFEGLETERNGSGVPTLVDTLGHLDCEPQSHIDSGDHRLFLARVVGGNLLRKDRPMVHIRNNGMRY